MIIGEARTFKHDGEKYSRAPPRLINAERSFSRRQHTASLYFLVSAALLRLSLAIRYKSCRYGTIVGIAAYRADASPRDEGRCQADDADECVE